MRIPDFLQTSENIWRKEETNVVSLLKNETEIFIADFVSLYFVALTVSCSLQ